MEKVVISMKNHKGVNKSYDNSMTKVDKYHFSLVRKTES